METKDKVLETMNQAGEPLNAGKIAELSGLDRKEVDKAMKQLKEEGAIVSPVRGASLIGRGREILMRIDRVGRTMTMGQGMCGSLSGSVPTNVGQPVYSSLASAGMRVSESSML